MVTDRPYAKRRTGTAAPRPRPPVRPRPAVGAVAAPDRSRPAPPLTAWWSPVRRLGPSQPPTVSLPLVEHLRPLQPTPPRADANFTINLKIHADLPVCQRGTPPPPP